MVMMRTSVVVMMLVMMMTGSTAAACVFLQLFSLAVRRQPLLMAVEGAAIASFRPKFAARQMPVPPVPARVSRGLLVNVMQPLVRHVIGQTTVATRSLVETCSARGDEKAIEGVSEILVGFATPGVVTSEVLEDRRAAGQVMHAMPWEMAVLLDGSADGFADVIITGAPVFVELTNAVHFGQDLPLVRAEIVAVNLPFLHARDSVLLSSMVSVEFATQDPVLVPKDMRLVLVPSMPPNGSLEDSREVPGTRRRVRARLDTVEIQPLWFR